MSPLAINAKITTKLIYNNLDGQTIMPCVLGVFPTYQPKWEPGVRGTWRNSWSGKTFLHKWGRQQQRGRLLTSTPCQQAQSGIFPANQFVNCHPLPFTLNFNFSFLGYYIWKWATFIISYIISYFHSYKLISVYGERGLEEKIAFILMISTRTQTTIMLQHWMWWKEIK